jgi:hypothetical protein
MTPRDPTGCGVHLLFILVGIWQAEWVSVYKYVQHCWDTAAELRQELSSEDVEMLRNELRRVGESAWLAWELKKRSELYGLLQATPAQRAKRKQWKDPILKAQIVLALYRQARLAALILDKAGALAPGGGYRETCAAAGSAALAMMEEGRWVWPFDDDPPFPGWAVEGDVVC